MLDENISLTEYKEASKTLKGNKSSGPDSISNDMIKNATPLLGRSVVNLFNAIINTECIPNQWKLGYIVPIFKKGQTDDPANYRGISIISCLGKLFSSILSKRLISHMEESKGFSMYQAGFMKNKRTSDHIFVVKSIIEEAKSRGTPIYGCFVDLKKAFDTVWRAGLFYKMLTNHKFSSKFVKIIRNMYVGLKGATKVNGYISNNFDISIELRQGCNLSPYLFNIYM